VIPFGNLGLHVLQYPSGRFGFVGHVPMELAFQHEDGTAPNEQEQKELVQANIPSMVCKKYGLKTRTFATEQDAILAAWSAGFQAKAPVRL